MILQIKCTDVDNHEECYDCDAVEFTENEKRLEITVEGSEHLHNLSIGKGCGYRTVVHVYSNEGMLITTKYL
jgi:hypothetical protein